MTKMTTVRSTDWWREENACAATETCHLVWSPDQAKMDQNTRKCHVLTAGCVRPLHWFSNLLKNC